MNLGNRFFILVLLICVLTGCITSTNQKGHKKGLFLNCHKCVTEKIITYEIQNGKHIGIDKTLFVILPDNGFSQWYVISDYNTLYLDNVPETSAWGLKASEDGKYLAVLSVAEGHPWIEIMNLGDILENKKTDALYEIDPYPGFVNIIGWENNYLYLVSNMLLTNRGGEYNRVHHSLELFSNEQFAFNSENGRVEAVSENIKKPADYYGRHLIEAPDVYSPMRELSALDVLNNVEAIPYLEKALTMKGYTKNRDDIRKLILKLRKTYNNKD